MLRSSGFRNHHGHLAGKLAGSMKLYSMMVILLVFLLTGSLAKAQQKHLNFSADAGTYVGSNSRLPLWLRANQFGTVPVDRQNFTGRLGLHYESTDASKDSVPNRKFRWGLGSELVINNGYHRTQFLLPEGYVKARWKNLELWAGRRKEVIGIVDTLLTSGAFTWSGNALPIPKIQIGFPEYVPLKFLKNFVSLKGYFVHGWYNTPYIQSSYLHQKGFYIRLAQPASKLRFQLGINHHVTWGGHAEYLKSSPHAVNGKLTDSFTDYLRGVVLGRVSKEFRNDRFTNFDGENRVGNHVGQYDLAIEYSAQKSLWLFYTNHPFEDASGVVLRNMPDGLYGLSWKNKSKATSLFTVSGILIEYLFSRDQSGTGWIVSGSRFKGNDNYFNHGQYIEGWSYFGKALGTPLIAPRSELRDEAAGSREFFPSSSVIAYHAGINGLLSGKIKWLAKASFSKNYGTNNIVYEPPLKQFSGLVTVEAPLFRKANIHLITRLAYDQGGFLVSSVAGYVGLRSSGWIK